MIALSAPWALVGLLALPILLWLDRRRRRAVPLRLPSLLFLGAADDADVAARRPRFDADLVLALLAGTLLTLAAASPTLVVGGGGRTVRVVVDAGPAMAARSADGTTAASRAEAAVDTIRASLARDDEFARIDAAGDALLPAARGGAAAVRLLVTDRARPDAAPDVVVVAVGDPSIADAGIASVDVHPAEGDGVPPAAPATTGARRVFVNVRADARTASRRTVRVVGGGSAEVAIPPGGAASATLDVAATPAEIVVRLEDPDGALEEGDEVRLDPSPLVVFVAPPEDGLPVAHADLVRRTLAVVAPGFVEAPRDRAALRFVASSASGESSESPRGRTVLLHPIAPGGRPARATPEGPFEQPPSDVGRDLDPLGCELLYDASLGARAPWPTVRRRVDGVVEWMPDPLAGSPPPADHPLWPIFVENVVGLVVGREGPSGYRVRGLLDPGALRLGRDRIPFDPRSLAAAPPDRRPVERPLRAPLVAAGLLCAAALWVREARARRRLLASAGSLRAPAAVR